MNENLTERERQILDLAARHLTSKQIGPLLGIRPASVDTFMQTIMRKLGVSSRKDAVIAYLAAMRSQAAPGRDDLDFGLSPVAGAEPGRSTDAVTKDGHPKPLPAIEDVSHPEGSGTWAGDIERTRPPNGRLARWSLGSPARRLVAVAIAALVLGLVTCGAVAVGWGLNRAFDRMFSEHAIHPTAGPGHSQSNIMQNLTGARIAKQLFSTEDAIDRTLGETARLIASMCDARLANQLPAIAGQRVIGGAAEALAALERARRSVLDTHEGLADLRDEYGLDVIAAGVLHKPEGLALAPALGAAA